MKKVMSILGAFAMMVGLSLEIISCGGDEPDTSEKKDEVEIAPGGPSEPDSKVPDGFSLVTLTRAEGENEIDLGWGVVCLDENGYFAMKNGSELFQSIFQVGKMQDASEMTKALYSGYPKSDVGQSIYGRPLEGYGYLARGRYGSKYARLYVTKVAYSPLMVTLYYEKQWSAIPENARIETNVSSVIFGKPSFKNTDVVTRTINITAPRGYEVVSKSEFVSDVVQEKTKMSISVDISKYPLPNNETHGEIILANEWMQSRVFVEFGGNY